MQDATVYFEARVGHCKGCDQPITFSQLAVRVGSVIGIEQYHFLCYRYVCIAAYEAAQGEAPMEDNIRMHGPVVMIPTEKDGIFWDAELGGRYQYNDEGNWEPVISL